MLDAKTLLGLLTIVIGATSYSLYFRDIFRHKTRPEAFSWLIWGILAGITYFVQMANGGGPGSWATLLTTLACLSISLVAFYRKCTRLRPIDILSLIGAALALVIWLYTSNPLVAIELVVAIGACGFIPTFAKAYSKPSEETQITFFLNALKFLIAIFAVSSPSLVTLLYPVAMVGMNASLGLLIGWRKARP